MLEWQPVSDMRARMIAAATTDDALAVAMEIQCEEADLPDDLRWIWRAYWRLSESRQYLGGGLGAAIPAPIAFGDIIQWAEHYEHDGDMTRTLEECIREMDRVYIAHMQAKAKQNAKQH